jgi:hypothetical protein
MLSDRAKAETRLHFLFLAPHAHRLTLFLGSSNAIYPFFASFIVMLFFRFDTSLLAPSGPLPTCRCFLSVALPDQQAFDQARTALRLIDFDVANCKIAQRVSPPSITEISRHPVLYNSYLVKQDESVNDCGLPPHGYDFIFQL